MVDLSGKEVEKYDIISKELSATAKAVEENKGMVRDMISALEEMEKELDKSFQKIDELRAAAEKEVFRLESMTINDDSMINDPVNKDAVKEEAVVKEDKKEATKPKKEEKKETDNAQPSLLPDDTAPANNN